MLYYHNIEKKKSKERKERNEKGKNESSLKQLREPGPGPFVGLLEFEERLLTQCLLVLYDTYRLG